MNKPRKTPVPLPSSKPRSKATAQNAALSQEFVNSSDDSSDETASQRKSTQRKAATNIAVHRPKANVSAATTSKLSSKKQSDVPRPAVKSAVPPKKPTPKQVVAEESAETSSSSEGSGDGSGTDIKAARQREKETTRQANGSTSSSESSSEDEEQEPAAVPNEDSTSNHPRPAQAQPHTVAFQPARPYVPPEGFQLASTSRAPASSASRIFDNLQRKQIWHITAPEDLSLKDLKELAMGKALDGEAIISRRGTDYGFANTEVDEDGARQVMIPHQTGFGAVPGRISQTFHIREVINLPKLKSRQADQNTGSEAAASITQSTIRAPRPQVKGLKMRFFPSGCSNHAPETLGLSDSEDDLPPRTAGLGVPNGIHLPSNSEKRKHEYANGDERLESPTKKHKKHRTPEENKRREEKKAKKERKREKESAKSKP